MMEHQICPSIFEHWWFLAASEYYSSNSIHTNFQFSLYKFNQGCHMVGSNTLQWLLTVCNPDKDWPYDLHWYYHMEKIAIVLGC